jgi:hypothetical protein
MTLKTQTARGECNRPERQRNTNMQDDNSAQSHPGQEPEIEQAKLPLLLRFHRTLYRIDNPDPAWSRNSATGLPECSKCGDTLTFCFTPRLHPENYDHAEYYQTPAAVRCNCFLSEPGPYPGMSYHRQLIRQPIAIVKVS